MMTMRARRLDIIVGLRYLGRGVASATVDAKWRITMAVLRRAFLLIGFSVSVCLTSFSYSSAQSSSLTAFYTAPVVSMAPMWIAKEAGFFKKQGLDVRLVFIASGPLGTTAILSGEVDVGIIGGFAPTRAIAGGAKNLVMIGQSKNRMTGAIVGKKEIGSVQDLKGNDWVSTGS